MGTQPAVPAEKIESVAVVADQPVKMKDLMAAWSAFAELRKDQVAEYQFLKREIRFEHPRISVLITNPVEDHLLDNFRGEFTQYLREKLKNSQLTIQSVLQESSGNKVIYTSKDKFDHLAGKNPHLLALKERLGLDWDF